MNIFSPLPLKDRPLGVRSYFIPVYLSACQLSFVLPCGIIRNSVSIPILLYLLAQIPKKTGGNVGLDALLAIDCSILFIRWTDINVLHISPRDFWQVEETGSIAAVAEKDCDGKVQRTQPPYPSTLWGQFRWNLSLWVTLRGVGWNWRVKSTPVVPANITKWYV